MAVSSICLGFSYLMQPLVFLNAFFEASTDKTTVLLIIALTLIRMFENIMRKNGIMQNMMDSFRSLVRDRRIVVASMPALIGLLPSMGGALFSAPMVDEASHGLNITSEQKSFINYLFRHPWEFISPLYPGLILASAVTAYPLRDLMLVNFPYAVCLTAGGIIWGLNGIGSQKEVKGQLSRSGILSFIPLALILILVMVFHLKLSVSMGIVILCLLICLKYSFKKTLQALKEGFSWELLVIILGVMTFKTVLDYSGAVTNISAFLSDNDIPVLPVLFFLPFIAGLLTGLTIGFVGATFPIIIGLDGAQNIWAISFAFASGYVGVLLSPVHLCLVLTREYFKASMGGIYHRIIKTGAVIMLIAVIEYFILAK